MKNEDVEYNLYIVDENGQKKEFAVTEVAMVTDSTVNPEDSKKLFDFSYKKSFSGTFDAKIQRPTVLDSAFSTSKEIKRLQEVLKYTGHSKKREIIKRKIYELYAQLYGMGMLK